GVFDSFGGGPAQVMVARWVAKMLGQEGEHRLLPAGGDRRRRVIVEIELPHAGPRSWVPSAYEARSACARAAVGLPPPEELGSGSWRESGDAFGLRVPTMSRPRRS